MAATTPMPRATARPIGSRRRGGRRLLRWIARAAFWAASAGMIALNAWWLWADFAPTPELRPLRGLVDARRYDEAEPPLRERLRLSPNDDESRMLLARILAGREQLVACARELHRVPFWSPRKAEALFLEGQAYLDAGLARPAEAALRRCVEDEALHPTPADFHKAATELLIELLVTEERWSDAQDVVWAMYDRVGPADRPAALVMWFRAEVERIDPKATVDRLRKYAAADPGDVEARRALAKVEQALGRDDEARRLMQACLAARPDDPRVWRDWLKILKASDDTKGMAEAIARLPASAENDPEILEYRGMIREAAGDMPGAEEAYRRAVEGKPFDEDFHYRLALVLGRLDRRDEARGHLDRSKALRAAHTRLVDAFIAYREALAAENPPGPRVTERAGELIELCRSLGHRRTAKALEANHPQPVGTAP